MRRPLHLLICKQGVGLRLPGDKHLGFPTNLATRGGSRKAFYNIMGTIKMTKVQQGVLPAKSFPCTHIFSDILS